MQASAACAPSAAGMVWVPPGEFTQGDDVYAEEGPPRRVRVAGFWMDRTEVTNDEFARFVQATGYLTVAERPLDPAAHAGVPPELRVPGAVVFRAPADPRASLDPLAWWAWVPGASWRQPQGPGSSIRGRGAYPVVAVTHADALAYARWAGRDLPTEAQWEWAARDGSDVGPPGAGGVRQAPGHANTWQGRFPSRDTAADGHAGLAPTGCLAPNARGLHDLIGNAWELTADAWRPSHAPDTGPPLRALPGQRPSHVIKGGSYLCAPNYCMRYRPGARQPQEDDLAASHVGFRTVRNAPGPLAVTHAPARRAQDAGVVAAGMGGSGSR